MAYRLPSERVPLSLDGPSVEVERIGAWSIYQAAVGLASAFFAADGPAAEFDALDRLFHYFEVEAQPSWDIEDHRGRIPTTAAGMLRLPLTLALTMVQGWTDTFVAVDEEQPASAVDALIPEGELRDELNARLRAVA